MILSIRAAALTVAGLGAIAAGTYGFAHAGGHSAAAVPPAVYGMDPAAAPDEPVVQTLVSPTHRVTVSFSNAPVQHVLDWLRKQDANFVVASSSLPSDLRLTISVKDEPLSAVEKVIATAMGGSWANHDGILVFQKGLLGDTTTGVLGKGMRFNVVPKGGGQLFVNPNGKDFELKVKDLDRLGDQFGPEFQKKIQDQFGPEFQKKIQEQFGPEFQKKLEAQAKAWQEQAKNLDRGTRVFSDGGGSSRFAIAHQDLAGLQASLTAAQKDLMKRRGYLTPTDLTDRQRRLLGDINGRFEMKIKSDKGEMTIRSE